LKTFLEIGCADFDTLIPLAMKGGWRGCCVEPIPHHVKTLKGMASNLPVLVVEAAVSNYDGQIQMAVGGGQDWAEGASHIVAPNHTGSRLLDLPANQSLRKDTIEVECIRLDTLIDKHKITEIDFCKIDVEGHEEAILRDYSWKVKPKFMRVEHKHTPGDTIDRILTPLGYTLFVEIDDVYAVL
jgi:FkbM family methyltransferase